MHDVSMANAFGTSAEWPDDFDLDAALTRGSQSHSIEEEGGFWIDLGEERGNESSDLRQAEIFRASGRGRGIVAEISLEGELDTLTAPLLWHFLERQLAAGYKIFLIDVQLIEFLGSAATSVFVSFKGSVERLGGRTVFINAHRIFFRGFSAVGLHSMFEWVTRTAMESNLGAQQPPERDRP